MCKPSLHGRHNTFSRSFRPINETFSVWRQFKHTQFWQWKTFSQPNFPRRIASVSVRGACMCAVGCEWWKISYVFSYGQRNGVETSWKWKEAEKVKVNRTQKDFSESVQRHFRLFWANFLWVGIGPWEEVFPFNTVSFFPLLIDAHQELKLFKRLQLGLLIFSPMCWP